MDRIVAGYIPTGDDRCRFDYNRLEEEVKKLVEDRLGDANFAMHVTEQNLPSTVPSQCHTFVVTTLADNITAPPVLFRSYSVERDPTTKCAIWQAARATSAAPTFFKPISIDSPHPPITYVDGGLRNNNPSWR